MPGKINPVICETVAQGAMAMIGHDAAITLACQSGQLELNAFLPLVAQSLLEGLSSLIAADAGFATAASLRSASTRLKPRRRSRAPGRSSPRSFPRSATRRRPGSPPRRRATGRTVRELARETGLIDDAELDRLLSPAAMTHLGARRRAPATERR